MTQEFMFYVRNADPSKENLSAEEHLTFVKQCEVYIEQLKAKGKLIAAQPMQRKGVTIRKSGDAWIETPITLTGEFQVGYYHIRADSIEEAIEIAKQNPEFEFVPFSSVEIQVIKTKEEQTNYEYPK